MTKRPLYAYTRWIGAAALAAAAAVAPAFAQDAPCAACVVVSIEAGQALALPAALGGLGVLVRVAAGDERQAIHAVQDIERRGGRAGLIVAGVPATALAPELAALVHTIVLDVDGVVLSPDVSFAVRQHVTAARASTERALAIGLTGSDDTLAAAARGGLAPYLDFLAWTGRPAVELAGKPAWRMARELTSFTDLVNTTASADAARWLVRLPPAVDAAAALASDLARARELLPAGLLPSPHVRVSCAGQPIRAYLNPETLETIAVAERCPRGAPIAVEPPEPGAQRTDLSDVTIVRVPAPGTADRFAAGVQVVGAQQLSVEEVIARHQAAAARQAAAIQSLISTGTLTLSFEAPGFPAPVTISSATVIYAAAGKIDLEQRAIRVNGIEFRGGGVPRLPIIEPERVGSPPLTITLTNVYRYRLDGLDTVDGTPCYVVAFDPIARGATLFRGRAWIAGDSFAMVKVAAVQTGLRGPIVASEQTDEYRKHASGLWLLARSDTRQMYEGAAHRTPIHRVLALSAHELNPADFAARLEAAYRSDAVMLRDTAEGYRYLRRDKPAAPTADAPATAAVVPVVTGRADRVRTLAAGVIVDPNISMPLPFAGLSYVDFNLFNTGAQLNAFFGGSYGQLAFSVPSLGGSRWQLAGRAFAIASSYNDRAFVQGREIYEQAIQQRPAHLSLWGLRPLGPRAAIRFGYDLDYTRFTAADVTAPAFVVPADQVVHGARLALDLQRDGWNASLWWNPARRSGWRAWGRGAGEYDVSQRDFQRYGASVTRSAVITPGLVGRLEAAVMAGTDLDRFSRYSFGTFDNRLRGYPSALIRYDRGGVLRGAMAWAAARFARVDLFADTAVVRDPGFGRRPRNYTGVGAAIEAPAPFGTLVAVEWGYGFRGVNSNGRLGTQVIRITGYKVF